MSSTKHSFSRRSRLIFYVLVSALSSAGTFPSVANSASEPAVPQAIENTVAAAQKEREQFEAYIKKQMYELEVQINALREKGTQLHETTTSQFNEKFEELKEQKDALVLKIEDLQDSSEKAWKDIRQSLLETLSQLQLSVSQAARSE